MAQIRFQVQGLAGSAARDVEQGKRNEVPPTSRIMGGSAARAAEERKLAEGSGDSSPRAGFSLRAQNGEVSRQQYSGDVRNTLTSHDRHAGYTREDISTLGDTARGQTILSSSIGGSPVSANSHPGDQSSADKTPQHASGASSILRRIMSRFQQSS
jgi:hypothetical protein